MYVVCLCVAVVLKLFVCFVCELSCDVVRYVVCLLLCACVFVCSCVLMCLCACIFCVVCVCVCFCVLNVFVCFVCELLCAVVRFVGIVFSLNEFVRWDASLKNQTTKEICMIGRKQPFGAGILVQFSGRGGVFGRGSFSRRHLFFFVGAPKGGMF